MASFSARVYTITNGPWRSHTKPFTVSNASSAWSMGTSYRLTLTSAFTFSLATMFMWLLMLSSSSSLVISMPCAASVTVP